MTEFFLLSSILFPRPTSLYRAPPLTMRLILIYMTRPTAQITESPMREGERREKGISGCVEIINSCFPCVYNVYIYAYGNLKTARRSSPCFRDPPAQSRPFPCFRRLLCHPFWSGEYENDFDDAHRAETPEVLLVGASFVD